MADPTNLLITCGGKWVGVLLQFRDAMKRVPRLQNGRILVATNDPTAPAAFFADKCLRVPPIADPTYIDDLLTICREHAIAVVVPLIDLDVVRLSQNAKLFLEIGAAVVCPPPELVDLCMDKQKFAQFCRSHRLAQPAYYGADHLEALPLPVFYKRRHGFGSIGSGICRSVEEARRIVSADPTCLFQELVTAPEISVDAYINRNSECTICVPRVREKVVAGEAYKSRTIAAGDAWKLAMTTAKTLAGRGLTGPLNIQVFETDPPSLIEVNTRLGSGCVLSNMAVQGRLLQSVLSGALGLPVEGDPSVYELNFALSRFLGDVFSNDSGFVTSRPLPGA
jgi:carbamoyl-phosphate synthase large subunit